MADVKAFLDGRDISRQKSLEHLQGGDIYIGGDSGQQRMYANDPILGHPLILYPDSKGLKFSSARANEHNRALNTLMEDLVHNHHT